MFLKMHDTIYAPQTLQVKNYMAAFFEPTQKQVKSTIVGTLCRVKRKI